MDTGLSMHKMIGKFFKPLITHKELFIFLSAILVSCGYLIVCYLNDRVGFPLDDAWIHQTYARNFAHGRGWSFIPGVPSSGSTSPLWTLLVSLGHFLQLPPIVWTNIVGMVFLGFCGFTANRIFRGYFGEKTSFILSLFFVLEWHFVWASVSGMETILCVLLTITLYFHVQKPHSAGLWGGIITGISIWVRPDLATMLIPVGLLIILYHQNWYDRVKGLLIYGSIVSVSLIGYLAFNYITSGLFMPTTFYAKQSEYAELRQLPYLNRYFREFSLVFVGAGILLLPGFLYLLATSLNVKQWIEFVFSLWYLLYVGLYASLLPVTYQHGRYMIPAMGIYYILGMIGTVKFSEYFLRRMPKTWEWVIRNAWKFSFVAVSIIFLWSGGWAYAKDVSFIERQMVDTAIWINENTPHDVLLAVHDIGAIGYFGQRKILDLAGLVSPEVIPFIRDEAKLKNYMISKEVDLLVCFPGWYPQLTEGLEKLYEGKNRGFDSDYQESMTVFVWRVDKNIR